MNNLDVYNKVRNVPNEAQKQIRGGRLNGFTDINPMWRIKKLTEVFGPCGKGWYYRIVNKWVETGANDEVVAFMDIELYVKYADEWSKGIPGSGGNKFISKEKSGLYTNDECYKMALTDAISVACKALGFGADVYWQEDKSKYDQSDYITMDQAKVIAAKLKPYGDDGIGYVKKVLLPKYKAKDSKHIKASDYGSALKDIVEWEKKHEKESINDK